MHSPRASRLALTLASTAHNTNECNDCLKAGKPPAFLQYRPPPAGASRPGAALATLSPGTPDTTSSEIDHRTDGRVCLFQMRNVPGLWYGHQIGVSNARLEC